MGAPWQSLRRPCIQWGADLVKKSDKAAGSGPSWSADALASKYRSNTWQEDKREEQSWELVERAHDGIIADAVRAVTTCGDAIQFSRSRDGGAFGVRVYDGGPTKTQWANTVAEAVMLLRIIIEDAERFTEGS